MIVADFRSCEKKCEKNKKLNQKFSLLVTTFLRFWFKSGWLTWLVKHTKFINLLFILLEMVSLVRQLVQPSVLFDLITINSAICCLCHQRILWLERRILYMQCATSQHHSKFKKRIYFLLMSVHKLATKMAKVIFSTPEMIKAQQSLTPTTPDELRLTTKTTTF